MSTMIAGLFLAAILETHKARNRDGSTMTTTLSYLEFYTRHLLHYIVSVDKESFFDVNYSMPL